MPPKIKFKVVKPSTSIGKSITGLSKAEMNKLSPLELFGKLPTELRKKIVNPKETGVKVGLRPVSSFKFDKIADNGLVSKAVEKWMNSSSTNISWIKGITPKMAKFYADNVWKQASVSLNNKDKRTMIKIEERLNENMFSSLYKEMEKDFKQWKIENKGKEMTEQQVVKSFGRYSKIIY